MSAADDIKKAFDEGYEKGFNEGFTAGQYDAQPEYEEISAENVAINLSPVSIKPALWWFEMLREVEKAGYVVCRKKT